MKTLIIALIGLFMFVNANAQNIPSPVKDAFGKKYPQAQNVKWVKEKNSQYEAKFNMNKENYNAAYSSNGNWLYTQTTVPQNQLPAKVTDAFNAQHKGCKLTSASMKEMPNGSKNYMIEYKNGKRTHEASFDENGNAVK